MVKRYLVKVDDENDMAEKIDLILNDNKLRSNMSEASRVISNNTQLKMYQKNGINYLINLVNEYCINWNK